MLSAVLTIAAFLLTALLYRRISANRCSKSGAPRTTPPPTPAMFRVTHQTATGPHPSSTVPSPGATDASSQQRSRLRRAVASLQPTPFDFAQVPVITRRALVPRPRHTSLIPSAASSSTATAMTITDSRPSVQGRPVIFRSSPRLPGDSLSASSSGPHRTSSSPSRHLTPTSGRLRREAFMALGTPANRTDASDSESDYDPFNFP
jgi:hypothetical protein